MSWPGHDPFGRPRRAEPEGYDAMQVCLNGHVINDGIVTLMGAGRNDMAGPG